MKTVLLIRHGLTAGNLQRRYIGVTDEPLCPQGAEQLSALAKTLPACDTVFASPMLRCRQTAAILFPGQAARLLGGLRECDFGAFEGKNADELDHDGPYARWVSGGCTGPIPGGEDVTAFKSRCCGTFARAAGGMPEDSVAAFVVHGGTIMSVLERFVRPKRSFYDCYVRNGEPVVCTWADGMLVIAGGKPC